MGTRGREGARGTEDVGVPGIEPGPLAYQTSTLP